MLSIIGLGNPGKEYQATRHNAGFQLVDLLAQQWHVTFQPNKKFAAEVAKTSSAYLLKPTTYMNESGRAVQSFLQYYPDQFPQSPKGYEQVYVVYDDLDIELGQYKLQFGKGPKVHNGLNSVVQYLGTDQFWHVRIGVDSRQGDRRIPSADYVLTGFQPSERQIFQRILQEVADTINTYVQRG